MKDQSISATSFWRDVALHLTSESALWIYSWAGLALAMIALAGLVFYMTHIARKLRAADFLKQWRGAKPKKVESIQKRIDDIIRFKRLRVFYVTSLVAGILTAGAVLPGGLLAMIAVWQDWFLPGPAALLIDGMPYAPAQTGFSELGLFVVDQALRGGLADTLEVFQVTFTSIENNPENFAYSGLVVLYRLIVGAAVAAMFFALVMVLLGLRNVENTIKSLEEKKREALAG
ncbi:MAG: hypothetical protein KF899_15920 [Parvibaculum sp.]|nr:hypothetical protein [Parvibaculum sp.]